MQLRMYEVKMINPASGPLCYIVKIHWEVK